MKTLDAAVGRWPGILAAFGIDEEFFNGKHQSCPLCGGKDRARFDNKSGKGTWICSQCGSGDGMRLAMEISGKTFAEVAHEIDQLIGTIPETVTPQKQQKDPAILLRKIHAELKDPKGSVVEEYLTRRCIALPPKDLFYHPSLGYYEDGRLVKNYPAMVAMFRNAQGKPNSYHVTYLNENGTKATVGAVRKIMPPKEKLNGGSIQLFEPAETIGVAEGIETALSAHYIHEIPVFAAANAGLLEQWEPPQGAKLVNVYGDNDANFVGQVAAYKLAQKLRLRGLEVQVYIPLKLGDWNDEVIGYQEQAA